MRMSVASDRPSRQSSFTLPSDPDIHAAELRRFFSENARRLAEEVESGGPIHAQQLMLLVTTAREIVAFERKP
jgi:hypothetical protein